MYITLFILMPLRSVAVKKSDSYLIHKFQIYLTAENILLVSFKINILWNLFWGLFSKAY